MDNENYYPIVGVEEMHKGSLFIALAAVMDMLDGLAARVLNAHSPIGKDLDSLADVVSFGVAPSMIIFKLLWMAYMAEPGALDTPMLVVAPAFLLAAFGALRLAKFNQTSAAQSQRFIGMPIPAVGLVVASFPLILFYNPENAAWLQNKWFLYATIAVLCWLMHSPIQFFKWQAKGGMANAWPQIVILVAGVVGALILKFTIVPILLVLYVILSIIYRPKVLA